MPYQKSFIRSTKKKLITCDKVGAGIILVTSDSWWGGIVKKPKLRKVEPLTIYEKLDYARLGCMKWPKYYYRGMNSHG